MNKEKQQVQKPSISFYVAGCMEFPDLFDKYEGLDLKEAVTKYKKIYKRNRYNVPCIGFVIKNSALSYYSDAECPLFYSGHIAPWDLIGNEAVKSHPLVQQAVKEIEQYVPGLIKVERQADRSDQVQ